MRIEGAVVDHLMEPDDWPYDKDPLRSYAVFHGGKEKEFMDFRGCVSTRAAPLDLGVPEPS